MVTRFLPSKVVTYRLANRCWGDPSHLRTHRIRAQVTARQDKKTVPYGDQYIPVVAARPPCGQFPVAIARQNGHRSMHRDGARPNSPYHAGHAGRAVAHSARAHAGRSAQCGRQGRRRRGIGNGKAAPPLEAPLRSSRYRDGVQESDLVSYLVLQRCVFGLEFVDDLVPPGGLCLLCSDIDMRSSNHGRTARRLRTVGGSR